MILVFFYWVYKKYYATKDDQLLLVAVTSAYSTILITNFVGFSTTTISLFFYLLPALLFAYFKDVHVKIIELPTFLLTKQNKRLLSIIPVVIFVGGFFYIASYFFADISYALGESYNRAQEYEQAAVYYKNALSLRDEHIYHDHLSQALANRAFIDGFEDSKSATVLSLLKESESHSKKALTESSQNPLYWRTNAKNNYLFFQLTHDRKYFTQAIESVQKAQKIAPTDPRLFYMEALFYVSQEKPTKKELAFAHEILDKAIKLKPNYRDAYFLKGTTYKKQKNIIEAKRIFELILSKIQPGDPEVSEELKNLK
jgi:tetratricopeptide (TPR) repeat protein